MKRQALVSYGAPLEPLVADTPDPKGTEVLLAIDHCGVCHSDCHLHDGYFDLGGGRKLDIASTHTLPLTLGHEIGGRVLKVGPDAQGVAIGDRRIVYPWIGCQQCAVCDGGDEHLCNQPRALGVNVDGGYADHVLVPHAKNLVDFGTLDAALAPTYMCSGLTAYGALKKLLPVPDGEAVAVVGLGGVGMMGLQLARTLFPDAMKVGVDVDDAKLAAAMSAGADKTYNSSERDAAKTLVRETNGGAYGVVDFVGSEASLAFANRAVRKGGRIVVVGLFGGGFSMPIPMFPLRNLTIMGSYVGSLAEAMEMMELVKAGAVDPIPIETRPLDQAGATLDDLRAGRVVGRVVLACES